MLDRHLDLTDEIKLTVKLGNVDSVREKGFWK